MARAGLSGLAVFYATAGGILLWSGVKGQTVAQTVRAVTQANAGALSVPGPETVGGITDSSSSTSGPVDPIGKGGNAAPGSAQAAANMQLAKNLAVLLGHPSWATGAEWDSWASLWNAESGWSTTALNASSGATGIPQLNPNAHPVPAGWSSATVQITWGINYIAGTYGDPIKAWQHETQFGWY